MKTFACMTFAAATLLGTSLVTTTPASAAAVIGFSFGSGDVSLVFGSPCYEVPVCGYPIFTGPVFIDGAWYEGPIYYRWYGGYREFWYHGGWRRNEWHGPPPRQIVWQDWHRHGAWRDGWHGDRDWYARHDNGPRRARGGRVRHGHGRSGHDRD